MAKAGEFVSRNAKAVVSGIGGILTVGTAAASMLVMVPDSMRPAAAAIAGFLAFLEVLRTVNVWIVKNGPMVAAVADQAEELFENVVESFEAFRGPRHAAPELQ